MNKETIALCISRMDGLNPGERAALRRNASKPYAEADNRAIAAFLKTMPACVTASEEEALFPTVCCRCLWKQPKKGNPFAKAVKNLASASAENRFISLLDEPLQADSLFAIKLFRLMSMLAASGYDIDWNGFAYDVLYWNHPERFVQKRWIREFYRIENEDANETIKEEQK